MYDGTPKIAIRGLHKSFGSKDVLRGLDLDVGVGESVVVIGGSGTGKSVMLKCILGLLTPDRGSITVDGEEAVVLPHWRQRVLVFLEPAWLLEHECAGVGHQLAEVA